MKCSECLTLYRLARQCLASHPPPVSDLSHPPRAAGHLLATNTERRDMTAHRFNTPTSRRLAAAAGVLALLASGCGNRPGAASDGGGEAKDANGAVNMVMAPDPVWKWMEDQGIKQEMEEAAGIQILTSSSWDEFGVYAGGHADVISAASYEVPDLEEATGEPATVFGKYNTEIGRAH